MPEPWKRHCPIDEEEWPVQRQAWHAQRQAWHAGWMYRMEHGPGLSDEEAEPIARRTVEEYSPYMMSVWLQGYSAADNVQRSD